MAIEKIYIEKFIELSKHHFVIDVRSPAEYNRAHLPGAYNLPLFSDEERKVVGTIYKQQSREDAIKVGLDFFGHKMRGMVKEVEGIMGNRQWAIDNGEILNKEVPLPIANCLLIYCWRGGMRSAGVAWLMDLYGFKVYTLIGGYKKFRHWVLDVLAYPHNLKILGGYTGSGKTELLHELKKQGEIVINLEDIAKHKGSAFGNIGMPAQPTQEMFENLLACELQNATANVQSTIDNRQWAMPPEEVVHSPLTIHNSRPIWLEDESQRIGNLNIPQSLWLTMRRSPLYFLSIPFEERLDHLVHEYGNLDQEKIKGAIIRIQKRLGGLEAKNAVSFLEENNIKECFRILLKYYDKFYLKGLHNRGAVETLLTYINCDHLSPGNVYKLLDQPLIHENR